MVETMSSCKVKSFVYQLDISESMDRPQVLAMWKSVSTKLIDAIVNPTFAEGYYLYSYTYIMYQHQITLNLNTVDQMLLRNSMQTWNYFAGHDDVYTLLGLKHVLQNSNSPGFIFVWTDSVGKYITNVALKTEVENLITSTGSEIFIMAFPTTSTFGNSYAQFVQEYQSIGHVMDMTDPQVIQKVIQLWAKSPLCPPTLTYTSV